jgi:hypothetical protein
VVVGVLRFFFHKREKERETTFEKHGEQQQKWSAQGVCVVHV